MESASFNPDCRKHFASFERRARLRTQTDRQFSARALSGEGPIDSLAVAQKRARRDGEDDVGPREALRGRRPRPRRRQIRPVRRSIRARRRDRPRGTDRVPGSPRAPRARSAPFTLVPIRPRSRCERRSLRTFSPGAVRGRRRFIRSFLPPASPRLTRLSPLAPRAGDVAATAEAAIAAETEETTADDGARPIVRIPESRSNRDRIESRRVASRTLVPIRPRSRGERRSLRTFANPRTQNRFALGSIRPPGRSVVSRPEQHPPPRRRRRRRRRLLLLLLAGARRAARGRGRGPPRRRRVAAAAPPASTSPPPACSACPSPAAASASRRSSSCGARRGEPLPAERRR